MLKFAVSILKLAYPERFELPLAVLETVVLPLNTKDTLLVAMDNFEMSTLALSRRCSSSELHG